MRDKFTTTIIVTETRVTNSGRTRAGGTYTLYQVIATKPSGEAINLNLRAFEDLPKNVPLEVDAELFRSQQYGDSYTLKRKGTPHGGSGSAGPRLDEIEKRVKRIEDFLSGRGEFGGSAAPESSPQVAQPKPPPAPPPVNPDPPAGELPSDDSIPF